MSRPEDPPSLKVIEEQDVPSEDVLRLENDGPRAAARPIDKLPLAASVETPTRLDSGLLSEERRSHEPDVEAIIETVDADDDPETKWSTSSKPIPYGWFVLIVLGVGVAVALAFWTDHRKQTEPQAKAAAEQRLSEEERDEAQARDLVNAVEARLSAFVAAESIGQMLPHIRHAGRVKPLLEDWYRDHPIEPCEFQEMTVFAPVVMQDRSFWKTVVRARKANGEEKIIDGILLEEFENGSVRVDWETSVCYQPQPWDEYAENLPAGQFREFRVMLEAHEVGPYSHEFRDESAWMPFRLTAFGAESFVYGYVRRGTPLEEQLYELYRKNQGRPLALILRLHRRADATSPRGVEITRIVSPNWVIVDES
jgi:hypothetical protein